MRNSSDSPGIQIGDEAPDFELPDINMKTRKLTDYRGKKLVLAFFPAAESPVCTLEMCNFRDSLEAIKETGGEVIGISVDGPFANKIFTNNRHLNFPLLSDYKKETIKRYGIVMNDLGNLKDYHAAKRSVFIVDAKGIVLYKWVSEDPLIEPNYLDIRSELKEEN